MKTYGWSRPALLIGFFLSSKIELLSYQTSAVYGISFLWRTGSIILIVITAATLWFLVRQKIGSEEQTEDPGQQRNQMMLTAGFLVLPLAMTLGVYGLDPRASFYPLALSFVLAVLLLFVVFSQYLTRRATIAGAPLPSSLLVRDVFTQEGRLGDQIREFLNLLIFLGMIIVLGFPIAMVAFIVGFISLRSPRHTLLSFGLGFGLLAITWVLADLLTLQYPAGLISAYIDMPWWLSGH